MKTSQSAGRRSAEAKKPAKAARKTVKLSRTLAPEGLSAAEWQRGLRRQFGREQDFTLENVGQEPFFSEFKVGNPQSGSRYRVAIRGLQPGDNYCACPDYATNELGTCKHIEFVLARLEKKRGAKAAFARGYQPPFSELYLCHGAERTVHFRAGTDCPSQLKEVAERLFDFSRDSLLEMKHLGRLEAFLAAAAKSGHELRAYDDALDFIAGVRDAKRRARVLDECFPKGSADPQLKKLLKVPLYPYQVEGALFAVRAGRALIGDEMGLGKTIQAIAAAEIMARYFGVTKVLVVCPTSLKYQWQNEIRRFSERDAFVVSGGRIKRQKDYAREDFCKITNFEKLQPDLDLIAAWSPDLVIVDEAQRVKNWNTIAARALKRIDSPYAVVLTGTPLENKLEELVSVVQYVDQHRMGPTWKLLHEHQVRDESGRVTGYTGLEKIGDSLAPIMIRRRKTEVMLQLPERTDQNLLVPMTEAQLTYHQDNANTVQQIVNRWRRTKFLSDRDQRALTCALQNMRMSCNSTYLLDQESDHGVKADELMALVEGLAGQTGGKMVVFSQWVRTHDIVIRRLEARNIGYVSFHGGIPSEKRPALIERFRTDPACQVFLSTDAGATGLNLQHASTLVNMDLPWNPALLEQRIARVHRMGQKQPVQIINFVAKGTIEEGMLSLLAFKRSLSAGILDGGLGEIALGGSRLNRFMKEVEGVTAQAGDGEPMEGDEELENQPVPLEAPEGEVGGPSVAEGRQERPVVDKPEVQADGVVDPWQALAQIGVQLVSALTAPASSGVSTHPWIDQDAQSGARCLRIPLPSPETASRLADALSLMAGALRSKQ
jgi:superfamily II DNA or RNA helicase